MRELVSIIIPAYNEAENIPVISRALKDVFKTLPYDYEFIFVCDGCTDNSLDVLTNLNTQNPELFFIEFSRNFGHQLAVKAGLDHAHGDCVICMDCDMQHPPSLLPDMIAKWKEGYEVVYTIREDDKRLPAGKRLSSKLYYKFLNSLSDVDLDAGSADFRLLDKKVVNVLRNFNESDPFYRGLLKWIGFKQYAIRYQPGQRHLGTSKYNLKKMIRLALHGVTSFSIKPLYAAAYLGFIFSLSSLLYIPYVLYALYSGQEVSGWASIIMTIVFFGGLQLIILGITGIYLGKMFMQSKQRPNYIVRSTNLKQA
ncbi:glycosyltransferase family 2 protein [Pseudopedobacter beijingensis]|uniref:Glycosyltransferase family 2 protein n=1 Tax=Pseudopedobacter beijingensis TaxID=1207056 RepID=A0ABW4IFH6_9SPHI